jgi:hypothetical protein
MKRHTNKGERSDQKRIDWGPGRSADPDMLGARTNIHIPKLFGHYRAIVEGHTTQLYDEGKYQRWPDGRVSVRVTREML